uniref:Uncharacterized protein n=1 Tax=Thermogemmatispora argillosa TaxID=2045280 RepID=A0A455T6K6_9CHLR|nr:hypothetical protein KTA_33700 [Thermogemmatispora argillosa]
MKPPETLPDGCKPLIERARAAGGERFADLVRRFSAILPAVWVEELIACVEELRQAILAEMSAEEALQALARATERLLKELPADPRLETLLAGIEGETHRSSGSCRPGRLTRASGAARGGQAGLEQHAAATLWE